MRFFSLLLLAGISGFAFAKDLTCFEQKRSQDVTGWIPIEFRIVLSEDLQTAEVKNPILEQFGQDRFEKGLFGSDLWARGKGRSKSGDWYNYQLQLRFEDNFKNYKIVMKEQGYRDLTVTGECELTQNLYSGTRPIVGSKNDGRSKDTWSTPSKPQNQGTALDGVITFFSPNSETFININLEYGYYEHSSKNDYFAGVYENALTNRQGQYIFYLGDDDFQPYESAWRDGVVKAFTRNGRKIVRITDPTMKDFAWQSAGKHLKFYIRVGGNWIGKELSGMNENRSKLNALSDLSN